ncbi:MAG: hypothetical protein GY874_09110 [Desulfobacteraceae bacterium]|nr:hypothetical protein [Desulfobacteraceae bacterium]
MIHKKLKTRISLFVLFFICTGLIFAFRINAREPEVYSAHHIKAAIAQPVEIEADFEDEEADLSDPALDKKLANATHQGELIHVAHFTPPVFFSERAKRSIEKRFWIRFSPFGFILFIAAITTPQSRRKKQRAMSLKKSFNLGKTAIVIIGIVSILSFLIALWPTDICHALQYSSIKNAVTDYLGKESKIYQTHIIITPDSKALFKKELGWTPPKSRYKVYYTKSDGGQPYAYVYVLSDKLNACGGLHKYCVKISAEGKIEGISIIELTCDRSYCINSKAFLAQFKRFDLTNARVKAKNYDAISGATQSTDLTRDVVLRALMLHRILNEQKAGA